jgi:hypothetical protein
VAVWQESSRTVQKLSIQEDEVLSYIRHLQDSLEATVFAEVLNACDAADMTPKKFLNFQTLF